MSYWDVLPPEIQLFVLRLRDNQALIDHRESERSRDLSKEIDWYGRVRERWAIGHIEEKHRHLRNGSPYICIFAHYDDLKGRKQRVFLAFDFHSAYYHCNAVRWSMLKGVVLLGK